VDELLVTPCSRDRTAGSPENTGRAIRIDDTLAAQDRGIHDAECGRCDAQPEGKADNGQQQDRWLAGEHPRRIPEVAARVAEKPECRCRCGWMLRRPSLEPQARDVVIQTPVRVERAAIEATCNEEFVQIGLHLGAHVARHGRHPKQPVRRTREI
jgi:hypothetical protein